MGVLFIFCLFWQFLEFLFAKKSDAIGEITIGSLAGRRSFVSHSVPLCRNSVDGRFLLPALQLFFPAISLNSIISSNMLRFYRY